MPVGEMLSRMDAREIGEWKAFFISRNRRAQPKKQSAAEARKILSGMAQRGAAKE